MSVSSPVLPIGLALGSLWPYLMLWIFALVFFGGVAAVILTAGYYAYRARLTREETLRKMAEATPDQPDLVLELARLDHDTRRAMQQAREAIEAMRVSVERGVR